MTFSVMTWNVENFFPAGTKLSAQGKPITQAQFIAKRDFLVSHIAAQNPDVVALQEVGGADDQDDSMITALTDELDGYQHSLSGIPGDRHIRVALVSKLPLHDATHLRDFPAGPLATVENYEGLPPSKQMSRGALSARVEIDGTSVWILTAHLKSKLVTYPNGQFSPIDEHERTVGAGVALMRRTAEAVAIRAHLNQLMQEHEHVIVLGDLNDAPRAATSQILLGPADGDIETNDQLDWVRLHNLTDAVPGKGVAEKTFLPKNETFSRRHEGRGEMLDQILASKKLIYRDHAYRIVRVRSFVELIQGESVSGSPGERVGNEASDHAPVLAEFDLA